MFSLWLFLRFLSLILLSWNIICLIFPPTILSPLWASWICGLVADVNLGKFSVMILSPSSFCSLLDRPVYRESSWGKEWRYLERKRSEETADKRLREPSFPSQNSGSFLWGGEGHTARRPLVGRAAHSQSGVAHSNGWASFRRCYNCCFEYFFCSFLPPWYSFYLDVVPQFLAFLSHF